MMPTKRQRNCQAAFIASMAMPVLAAFLFVAATTFAAPQAAPAQNSSEDAVLESVVSLIEKGQWDNAESLVNQQPDNIKDALQPVQAIIQQYRQTQQRRQEKQQQVYAEKYQEYQLLFERFIAKDPNTTALQVFKQADEVWDDATEAQRAELTSQEAFQALLAETYQQGLRDFQDGNWKKARSESIKWLLNFARDNTEYKALDGQLDVIEDVRDLFKKDPCDDKIRRYVNVKPETTEQVFAVLQARYVKPINFYSLAQKAVRQCVVAADILNTDSDDILYKADAEQCKAWKTRLDELSADLKTKQADVFKLADFLGVQDILLAINSETLKLPDGVVLAMLTEAALAQLDDYTKVIWPAGVADFEKQITGRFGGVGFRVSKDDDIIRITSLIPNTPAARSTLKPEAQITAIDGELTKDLSLTCAVRRISGPIGTSVTLTVKYSESDKPQLVTLVRDKIVLPTVEGSQQADSGKTEGHWDYFLGKDDKIGYLRLSNFTAETVPQVKAALEKLQAADLAGLMLDLRGNGGGLLTAATELSDLFVNDGLLLESRGRNGQADRWQARKDTVNRNYPIVILIDDDSASASEIVAGVLGHEGYKRAVLVGDRSYGKGSVQEVIGVGAESGRLKFTSAYYYLPNGKAVPNRDLLKRQGRTDWGIVPDVSVPLFDFEQKQIRESNKARRAGSTNASNTEQPSASEQMIAADSQLATALLVLKARMTISR